jgi:hypothetical protein
MFFRCNTHTAPNFRIPPTARTHDPDCTANCLDKDTSRVITAVAYRAQRNTTGYYTGYMQKRQPVGAFELKQATANLKFLQGKLQGKSNAAQYHNMANRVLGDLEFRGHVRPITEEFNLPANYHEHDVCNAELYRTFGTATFCGAGLLRRLRRAKDAIGDTKTKALPLRKPVGQQRAGSTFHISFEDAYGYRGIAPSVYYLSPWEFTALWSIEYLKPPSAYRSDGKTMWTQAGLVYKQRIKDDKKAPAPTAGEHYVVVDCIDPTRYLSFPQNSETEILRHNAVFVRRNRPHVPQPSATPLPTSHLSEEERGRIFSVYLRPWVLRAEDACAHVPLLADVDILVSDVLSALQFQRELNVSTPPLKRLRGKQLVPAYSKRTSVVQYPHVDSTGRPLQRCYAKAWKDYRCGHIVSKYAARIIQ